MSHDFPENIRYEQPVQGFTGRELQGSLEHVNYIPRSHMRIWYNTQEEGYSLHHHNALEIVLCKEKNYTVRAGDATFCLEPGDILFIAPHVLHELAPEEDGGSRFIFLVDLDSFLSLQDFNLFILSLSPAWLCNRNTHAELYEEFCEGFREIINNYFSNEPLWELAIYSRLLGFFLQISRLYLKGKSEAHPVEEVQYREDYGKLTKLINYLNDHYAEKITQEQAADIAGFSKYYFSRLFRQVTGFTFPDYLAQRRITKAQALLSSECPITEIAFQTGFSNLSSFNRCFRKFTNCSPSDYRSFFRQEHL